MEAASSPPPENMEMDLPLSQTGADQADEEAAAEAAYKKELESNIERMAKFPYEIEQFMSDLTLKAFEDALNGVESLPVHSFNDTCTTSTGALTEDLFEELRKKHPFAIPPACLQTGVCSHDADVRVYRYPPNASLGPCMICPRASLDAAARGIMTSRGCVLAMPKEGEITEATLPNMTPDMDRSIFPKSKAEKFADQSRVLEIGICVFAHLSSLAFFCLPCGHYHVGCPPELSLITDDIIVAARKVLCIAAQAMAGRRDCHCSEFKSGMDGAPRDPGTVYVVSARHLSEFPSAVYAAGLSSPSDRVRDERPVAQSAAEYLLSICRTANYSGMEPFSEAAKHWEGIKFEEARRAAAKPHKRAKFRSKITCDVATAATQMMVAYSRVVGSAMAQRYVCEDHEVDMTLESVLRSVITTPMYFHPEGIENARHTRAVEKMAFE